MTKPGEMERVRAAREVMATRRFENDEAAKMQAFMDIFHPGHPVTEEAVREMRLEQRTKGKG